MDDFNHRLSLAANNILDDSNNVDTNDFTHRLEVAANGILDESCTQRRQPKRRCAHHPPLNKYLVAHIYRESVSSTSSSGSDNISVIELHPQFIDLTHIHPNDPGGWNSHREA